MKTNKVKLEWTGYATDSDIEYYLQNLNSDLEEGQEAYTFDQASERISEDTHYWGWEWEGFTESLTELMGGREYWEDNATGMGWQNRGGSKVFEASNGEELLREISPDTDCSYVIEAYYNGFKIRIGHHDAPMGELHIVRPLTEDVYQELYGN